MTCAVAVIGPGTMGSAIGVRLAVAGAAVGMVSEGRSPASHARIRAAGLRSIGLAAALDADLVLSIVPPTQALGVARTLAGEVVARSRDRPLPTVVDCNAVSPATMAAIAEALASAGLACVDACIIGVPPRPEGVGPSVYLAGALAERAAILAALGLQVTVMPAEIGAASALKMCYAGISKGATGLGAAMSLAAARADVSEYLRAEMARTMPSMLAFLDVLVPGMFSRSYRWAGEMHEIADFIGPDFPESEALRALAALFERLALDEAEGRPIRDTFGTTVT